MAAAIKRTACLLFGREKESSRVRAEAMQLLTALLGACGSSGVAATELGAATLATNLLKKDLARAAPPTVRQQQLHLLGALCRHQPAETAELAPRAASLLLAELQRQLDSSSAKLEKAIVAGALTGLTGLLHSFTAAADDPATRRRLYASLLRIINPASELSRREAPRAGLALLTAHAAQFGSLLYADHVKLLDYLTKWAQCTNRDDGRAGVAALDAFLDQLCQQLLAEPAADRQPPAVTVFTFALGWLRRLQESAVTPPAVLSLAVGGCGALVAPCARLCSPHELAHLVDSLLQWAEQRYPAGAPPTEEQLLLLPAYVWALGCALTAPPTLAAGQPAVAERMLLLLSELYPRLPPSHRFLADRALARCLLTLLGRPELGPPCLQRLVYQMLLRCCCHPVAVEAELQRDAAQSYADRPLSCRDFLPLWDALLAAQSQRELTRKGVTIAALAGLSAAVYRALVEAGQQMITDLDLSTSTPDDDAAADTTALTATTPKDFLVFINLVSVLEHVLLAGRPERLRPWLAELSRQLVVASGGRPLVSGLYRLSRVCLLTAGRLGIWPNTATAAETETETETDAEMESDEARELRLLWASHVKDTAARCHQYRDELQEACLSMVLATPAALARHCAPQLLQVARLALHVGRNHLPLARRALDALDAWMPALSAAAAEPDCAGSLRDMVPAISRYLAPEMAVNTSTAAAEPTAGGGGGGGSSSARRSAAVDVRRIGRAAVRAESELSALRARALQLLGALAAAGLVADDDAALTGWSRQRVLGLAVPFSDVKPTLWLEAFLPRTVELALGGGDAQTALAACELLQAATLYTLAAGAPPGGDAAALRPVYARLLPALLRLAASANLTASELFRPLLTQLTHWFTTELMVSRPEAALLLDTLLQGLADPTDVARRDVSAQLLREFLLWALRQASGGAERQVAAVLERLYGYLRHPDPYRRLGGTLAFNSVYRVLREHAAVMDVHLLALTAALLAALARAHADPPALGTADAAAAAVAHCQRMLKKSAAALSQPSGERRVPVGWPEATLPQLLRWLVSQCGAPQTELRHACYRLLTELAPLARGGGSVRQQLAEGGGAAAVLECALTGVYRDLSGPVSAVAWLDALLAALDGYSWALPLGALPADRPLTPDSFLVDNVRFLLSEAFRSPVDGGAAAGRWAFVRRLRCVALVRALTVLEALLRAAPDALHGVWSPAACDTIAAAVMAPVQLGFDVTDAEVVESLPAVLTQLLRAVADRAGGDTRALLAESLARRVAGRPACQALREALRSQQGRQVSQQLRGLQTLHASRLLAGPAAAPAPLRVSGDDLFAVVWEAAVQETAAGLRAAEPVLAAARLAQAALGAALRLGVSPPLLLRSLLSDEPVCVGEASGGGSMERGWLLFSRFSSVLVPQLLQPAASAGVLAPLVSGVLSARAGSPPHGLALLTGVARATAADRQLRRQHGEQLAQLVAADWPPLRGAEDAALLPLLGLLLLSHLPLAGQTWASSLVSWYRDLLTTERMTLEQKRPAVRLLQAMLRAPALAADVSAVLERLETLHFPLDTAELKVGSPARATYCAVLASLCEAVELTALPALARHLAALLSRETHHLCADALSRALAAAMQRHGAAEQLALAETLLELVWPAGGLSADGRRTLLTAYLCPTLRAAGRPALLQLYTAHIVSVVRAVQEPEPACLETDSEPVQHQWVSRTAGFALLELLYAALPKELVHAATSPLVAAFAGAAGARGNELTKTLISAGSAAFKAPPLPRVEAPALAEARRRCLCAAYNALAAAVSCTQTEVRFFNAYLFAEDPAKHQSIWERLVDPDRQYQLPVDARAVLRRRPVPVPTAADGEGDDERAGAPGSVGQFLSDSSLSSQATEYDFTAAVVLNSQEVAERAAAAVDGGGSRAGPPPASHIELAEDDLNDHECMPCVTALVRHLAARIDPPPEVGPPAQPPAWADALIKRLRSANTPDHVLLFLVKLVTNCEPELRPYSPWLLPALLDVLAGGRLGEERLNALLLDVLEVLAVWADRHDIVPEQSAEARPAADALLRLVLRLTPSEHRAVVRHMLDLFGRLVSGWAARAAFPSREAARLLGGQRELHAPRAAVCALRAGLLVRRPLELPDAERSGLLARVLELLPAASAEVYRPAGEVAGLLCAGSLRDQPDGAAAAALEAVRAALDALERQDRVRWVTCLACVSAHCRQAALTQRGRLLFALPALYGEQRTLGLRVLRDIAELVPDVSRELPALQLPRLAETRDAPLQRAVLCLLERVSARLSAGEWRAFLPAMVSAVNCGPPETRRLAAELCIVLRGRFGGGGGGDAVEPEPAAAAAVNERAKEVLLALLTDPEPTVRQTAANHWASLGEDSTPGRLAVVLSDMFRPGLEPAYLGYATYLVLGLTARTPDFLRPMFERALPECQFSELAVVANWRVQSAAAVPLFSQSATGGGGGGGGGGAPQALLRATQRSLAFTPTQASGDSQASFDWMTQGGPAPPAGALRYADDTELAGRHGRGDADDDPLARMLRRRVETDARRVSARMARQHADRRALHEERQRDEADRRDGQVSLLRRYRQGELPDTQIPYSDLLRPLQAVAMRDPPTACRLLVGLLTGTLDALQEVAEQPPPPPLPGQPLKRPAVAAAAAASPQRDRLVESISAGLADMLLRMRAPEPSLVSAALQAVMAAGGEAALPAARVVSACQLTGQLAAGIQLMERALLQPAALAAAEPAPKQPRRAAPPAADELWTGLAELYAQRGDLDSARAALSRCAGLDADRAAALEAKARGDYFTAARHYEQTGGGGAGGADRLSDEAYFQCLAELSEWGRLSRAVDQRLTPAGAALPDLAAVWRDGDAEPTRRLLPWLVRGKTQLAVDDDGAAAEQLHGFLDAGLASDVSRRVLESRFPEELALRFVSGGDLARARFYCQAASTAFLRDWSAAAGAGGPARRRLLQRLRGITELQEFLAAAAAPEPAAAAAALLERWQRHLPAPEESLTFWETTVSRRELYARRLRAGAVEPARLQRHLRAARLRLVEAALGQGNTSAAGRQLGRLRAQQRVGADAALTAEYHLLRSRAALLQTGDAVKAWRALDTAVPWRAERPPLPAPLLFRRARLEAQLAERYLAAEQLGADDFVCRLVEETGHNRGDGIQESVRDLAFSRLEQAMEATKDSPHAAQACLEAAKFCSRQIEAGPAADGDLLSEDEAQQAAQLRGAFVRCTLSALAAGSSEAADWLPHVLQMADEQPAAAAALRHHWQAPPVWRYLDWLPQLFSYGGSAGCGAAVRPLLLRLAEQYPQAVVYPLAVSRAGAQPRTPEMAACLERAQHLLGANRLPEQLIAELGRLALYARLRGLQRHLAADRPDCAAAEIAGWGGLAAALPSSPSEAGRSLLELCGDDGAGLSADRATRAAQLVDSLLRSEKGRRTADVPVADFSAWLAAFQDVDSADRLELPGQYQGRRRPQPERHVCVANVARLVRVLPSIERPVCVTLRGDDAREYRYLVKGGDDLRTDQRLQQLMAIMNGSLAADRQAAARRLAVRTYQVLPLRPTLGLIEWLEDTETLHQFIGSATDGFEAQCAEARELFERQLRRQAGGAALHNQYALRAARATVEDDYRRRRETVRDERGRPSDALLRRALLRLSAGPEALLRLRTNLLVSHALLSAAGWLFGVGDRHLANLLVSLRDGALVAIDFGHAFGSAAGLPVPELVPFRLTPQLAGLAAPLGPAGLTRHTLLHAVRALRRSHHLLAATLEVFVREPAVPWAERAPAPAEHAARCVRLARGRLRGAHPAADLRQLLADSPHLTPEQAAAWTEVARGRPGLDRRADLPDTGLTEEQQVDCLIDLATDPHVLGLAYSGWAAHI